MAQSSPGPLPGLESIEQTLILDDFGDFSENVADQEAEPERTSEYKEHQAASPFTSDKNHVDRQSTHQNTACGPNALEAPMLLEKPLSLSKSLDLDKPYEYGPAVQFAPGFFTKMPGKQAPVHPGDLPQHAKNDLSPRSAQQAGNSRPRLPPLSQAFVETPNSRRLPQVGPSNQPQAQPPATNNGPGFNSNSKFEGAAAARNPPQLIAKPPFPDTSPKEPAALPGQARLSSAEKKPQDPNPEPPTSPYMAQYQKHAVSPHDSPGYNQVPPAPTVEKGKGHRHHHHQRASPTEGSRHSTKVAVDRSGSHIVNRPMREMAHVRPARSAYRYRPESRSSNVSRQMSRCGSLTSSPMIRQRRVNISHQFTTEMADVINQFTREQNDALEQQKTKYHKYVKRLRRDLADGSAVIAQQLSQIDGQTNEIKDLQAAREQMASQLKDIEEKLHASEDRTRRLEEKYRACKTHLNSAIQEQQDLYTRSKKQWAEAIEQVRAMDKAKQAETETVVRKAEVIREEMMEKLRKAITQNKSEALGLYGKIDGLTQQVEEKEAELTRERESVRTLSEKLDALQATSDSFEKLASQGSEILQKLGDQQAKTEEQQQKSSEELRNRLDVIANRLEVIQNVMSGQPEVMSGIRESQDESFQGITAKLDDILESRDTAREATCQLSTELDQHLEKIWQRLDKQVESLSTQLAEKAEENGMVSTLYKRKDAECEEYRSEVAELRATTEKQMDQIQDLEASLVALDAAQEENEETIRRLEASGTETARLREELELNKAAAAELQSKLDAEERRFASELQRYGSDISNLVQTIQEKDQSSGAAAIQAAETARREVRNELDKVIAKTEKSLQETQRQRDSLAEQLELIKKELQGKEHHTTQDAATIRSLQKNLAAEEAKAKALAEQLAQRSANLEDLENRLTSRAKKSETELNTIKNRAVDVEDEGQQQRAKYEALIAGLTQWAQQGGLAIQDLDFLKNGNKSPEEISAGLARASRHLLLSRRSETVTPEEHAGDLLHGENSKFFPADRQSQRVPSSHAEDMLSMNDNIGARVERSATGAVSGSDPLPYASTLDHMRRVIVRSPANVPNEPAAPSVDQEKARRREAEAPKSIMKRVTRSTSSMLKQVQSDGNAGQGVFKRSRPGDGFEGSFATNGSERKLSDAGISQVLSTGQTDATSNRPSKRRRSNAATSEESMGDLGSSTQGMKRKPSMSIAVRKTEETQNTPTVIVAASKEGFDNSQQTRPGNTTHSSRPAARNSRSNSGTSSRESHRAPTVSNPRVLAPRQPNVRTYGSQRAAAEPAPASGFTDARFSLQSGVQSQSQSRYWARPKEESQESITFSQSVGADENLLLPLKH